MIRSHLWHRAFLERHPSLSLGLFRLAVAFTVGAHMIPSFFHMEDNYLSTAFKTKNFSFFPIPLLRMVEASPDWFVYTMTICFCVTLTTFAIGLCSQLSCILLTLACYYFYALNNFHIGTLSFDILLVTLVLLCMTGYHGDFLSVDSLIRGDVRSYRRRRPYFIQRLLQLQVVLTFWQTSLNKISGGGNWLSGNPYYDLMCYPPMGVVRNFPFRSWLAHHPAACHAFGMALIPFELTLPLLLLFPPTRVIGVVLGILFMLLLWITLHVPTIFLFLFPPLILLFVSPEVLVRWIETRQGRSAARGRSVLLYDGHCGFCLASVRRLRVLDLFGWVDPLDFHIQSDLTAIHPLLTPERCRSEMVLLAPNGDLLGGFDAFRRISWYAPLLWPLLPWLYLPGARWIGRKAYRWIATHRYLFHRNPVCATNQCALPKSGNGAS